MRSASVPIMLVITHYALEIVQDNHAATGAAHTSLSTGAATGHAHCTDFMLTHDAHT